MAESNWSLLGTSLGIATVDRGATAGVAKPNGGGSFCYGYNSLAVTPGAVGLFASQVGFAPTTSGGTVRGAIQRGVSAGVSNFSPFLYLALQGPDVTDTCYMLGLADGDPHHIVLKKGALSSGMDDLAPDPDVNGVLLRSTAAYTPGTWLHLRLDCIVQGTGDVLLQCYANDLATNPVTAPVWVVIPGMEGDQFPSITGFIDDALQVNTGSAPLVGGRMGFAMQTADAQRRAFFDHVIVGRQ